MMKLKVAFRVQQGKSLDTSWNILDTYWNKYVLLSKKFFWRLNGVGACGAPQVDIP